MKFLLFASCLVLSLHAQAQGVYKCPGAGGQITFQQAPCSGGQTVNSKPANVVEGNPDGDRSTRDQAKRSSTVELAVATGQVLIGMTENELLRIWGNPTSVNTDNIRGKTHRQLVFRGPQGTKYAYTENGILTSTQLRPDVGSDPGATTLCYSEQEIKNARTSTTSITLDEDSRRRAVARVDAMRPCSR